MSKAKDGLRRWVPPALLDWARAARRGGLRFAGDYPDWSSARAASAGYDDARMLEVIADAARQVRDGRAVFQRDGMALDRVLYSFPTLAAILRASVDRGVEPLSVIDFGGGFGSSFAQVRAFCPALPLHWTIVEQPDVVAIGRREFETDGLRFHDSLEACLTQQTPRIALLSSVLQYLEEPHAPLTTLQSAGIPTIVIDRTPCSALDRDVLTVQSVPPALYEASYPCWILSESRLCAALAAHYTLLTDFEECSGPWRTDRFEFALRGFVFDRKAP